MVLLGIVIKRSRHLNECKFPRKSSSFDLGYLGKFWPHCGIKIFLHFVDLEKLWPHCGIKNRDVVNNGRSRHLNECKFP